MASALLLRAGPLLIRVHPHHVPKLLPGHQRIMICTRQLQCVESTLGAPVKGGGAVDFDRVPDFLSTIQAE